MTPPDEWFAAVLDVSGMMKFIRRRSKFFPAIDIHNEDLSAMFANRFGGNKSRWHVSGRHAQEVVKILWPHMHIKTQAAAEIIAWKPTNIRTIPLKFEEKRKAAVRTMVAMGEAKLPLGDSYSQITHLEEEKAVW